MKHRVVITGVGILSSIGNTYQEVSDCLRAGRSGIVHYPQWEELGLRSTIGGRIDGVDELAKASQIPRSKLASMPRSALYCVLAAKTAIENAGLSAPELNGRATGCIVGAGISCVSSVYTGGALTYEGKAHRMRPHTVLKSMASSASANLANIFAVGGRSYSVSAACATATHNIGHAFELIRAGALECAIAGGGEEVHELTTSSFSALRIALSSHFNDSPKRASRPFDRDRDGFVISGGGGIVILETLERACRRGAPIHGEIIGYAATSDGYDIIHPEPDGKGAAACMSQALDDAGIPPWEISYLNAHGTSTVAGDRAEINAVRRVFADKLPYVSSTKSMGGHAIGASGAHELIHCLAMLEGGFVAPSINIDHLDPEFEDVPIVTETREERLNVVVSNSFGFGGTNGVLVVRRYE